MVYKFRAMVADAEAKQKELMALDEADGPVFKIKKDPRIIPFIGTLLRKTGLDELPQLINVLRGEMGGFWGRLCFYAFLRGVGASIRLNVFPAY